MCFAFWNERGGEGNIGSGEHVNNKVEDLGGNWKGDWKFGYTKNKEKRKDKSMRRLQGDVHG